MQTNIIQHTEEWHSAKLGRIGGSEIGSLVQYYCAEEVQKYLPTLAEESFFSTPFEIFFKIKHGVRVDNDERSSDERNTLEYGTEMEKYAVYRANKEYCMIAKYEGTDSFWENKEINKYATCSPDGFVELFGEKQNFGTDEKINSTYGKGLLEIKTAKYGVNFENELSFQYILQLQWNMLVTGCKWGSLFVLLPKDKEGDELYNKGRKVALAGMKEFEILNSELNAKEWCYTENKTLQQLCILAIQRFEVALGRKECPILSPNATKNKRERVLLRHLKPSVYGEREAIDGENELINRRMELDKAIKKNEKEKLIIENKLLISLQESEKIVADDYTVSRKINQKSISLLFRENKI